jgi:hypothetical protein
VFALEQSIAAIEKKQDDAKSGSLPHQPDDLV